MKTKVCIAEKPSVAREIANILGARSRKDGFFEGNGYSVTWTFGHFCTLKEPDDYQSEWKKWTLTTLPVLPEKFETKLINNKGVKKQFGIIKKLLKSAEMVINCGDAGQEGELIQRWVLNQAKYKGKVQRLWISSLTPEAIRAGFRNLKDAKEFDNLYYAGMSRAIGDWILGMNATRLYTLKYGGFKQVLSIGRVQTPTLAMLVERHKEIENFVPHPFWELQTLYRDTAFNCVKGRFLKKEEGEIVFKQVNGQPFKILSFEKKKGKEAPPRLFDLTSLQVHCNKRFSYSADQTLKLVQKLYEQKVVTYPRVDTTYLPNDVYPKIGGILGKMTNYNQFTQPLLGKTIRKSAKVFNDKKVTDHHAIIPTGVQKTLPANEQNVYDAIARRFIGAFYPDCIVSNTTVIGESNGVKFKASGKEILEDGWRVLFPKLPKNKSSNSPNKKGEEEKILPVFKVGESGSHKPALVEKQTQPPKNYTEATLLRSMETAGKNVDDDELRDLMKANGIGRPSTRAAIIETLFRRLYIERRKKLVVPTDLGIQLIDKVQNNLLKSAELTGQWEKQLRDIETGKYFAKNFIADMKKMVVNLVEEVKVAPNTGKITAAVKKPFFEKKRVNKTANTSKMAKQNRPSTIENPVGLSCPKCFKGKLLKGKTAFGCSRYSEGCSFRLPFEYGSKKISEKQLLRLMKYGSTIQLKGFKKQGKKVNGRLKFNDVFELILEEKVDLKFYAKNKTTTNKVAKRDNVPEKIPCPKCSKGQVVKGKTAYGCSRWNQGCDFRFLFEDVRKKAAGQTLTKQLVWEILNTL
ncbi:MAG: DNA topoisomerase 3 [Saprospiraceae bacterium]|nr:DNA topoisomerase 3 [Saprospiraceae bacterium]